MFTDPLLSVFVCFVSQWLEEPRCQTNPPLLLLSTAPALLGHLSMLHLLHAHKSSQDAGSWRDKLFLAGLTIQSSRAISSGWSEPPSEAAAAAVWSPFSTLPVWHPTRFICPKKKNRRTHKGGYRHYLLCSLLCCKNRIYHSPPNQPSLPLASLTQRIEYPKITFLEGFVKEIQSSGYFNFVFITTASNLFALVDLVHLLYPLKANSWNKRPVIN